MNFTEQETLQDALIAHKYIINMYCQYGIECSNKELRELFSTLQKVAMEHDLKIFKIMNDKGFYPTTPAAAKDVTQAVKMHTQMQKELETKLSCKEKSKK